jgi:hypothetical protein
MVPLQRPSDASSLTGSLGHCISNNKKTIIITGIASAVILGVIALVILGVTKQINFSHLFNTAVSKINDLSPLAKGLIGGGTGLVGLIAIAILGYKFRHQLGRTCQRERVLMEDNGTVPQINYNQPSHESNGVLRTLTQKAKQDYRGMTQVENDTDVHRTAGPRYRARQPMVGQVKGVALETKAAGDIDQRRPLQQQSEQDELEKGTD